VESFLPWWKGCQLLAFGYPKQMTWPSAVATTTLPLATAGKDVTGEGFVFPDFTLGGPSRTRTCDLLVRRCGPETPPKAMDDDEDPTTE
jgi:hypothetical protein